MMMIIIYQCCTYLYEIVYLCVYTRKVLCLIRPFIHKCMKFTPSHVTIDYYSRYINLSNFIPNSCSTRYCKDDSGNVRSYICVYLLRPPFFLVFFFFLSNICSSLNFERPSIYVL